jgi:GT2 family glycosyltransferase
MLPLVVTVILNTNRRDDTLACLSSLAGSSYPNHRVIVLDNQSTDGSAGVIREQHPGVQVLTLAANRGYAGNNNTGISEALNQAADWVFVLNEDTVLDAACLAELVRAGEGDVRIGAVGPLVYHHSEPGVIQSAGGQLGPRWESRHAGQNEPDVGQFPGSRDVDWVTGCAMLMRADAIRGLGGFDERFFYYWEETEWCLRARRGGWRVVHCPAARLWHKGVQRDYRPGPDVTYYSVRNRLLLMSAHGAPAARRAAVWAENIRTMANWTLNPKWRHMRHHRDALWQGMADYLRKRWGQRPS